MKRRSFLKGLLIAPAFLLLKPAESRPYHGVMEGQLRVYYPQKMRDLKVFTFKKENSPILEDCGFLKEGDKFTIAGVYK